MTFIARLIPLTALIVGVCAAGASAQTNNPGNSGGTTGSMIATPTYPRGEASDPALSSGRLTKGATNVPAARNPNVAGATGHGIVPGDNSTIGGDRRATTEQKTGGAASSGSGD